jgi:imidazolonepropionase
MNPFLFTNIGSLVRAHPSGGQGDLGVIADAAMAVERGRIAWVGTSRAVPHEYETWDRVDLQQKMVVPGLIDCHTHLAFGGWRADEFEQRLLGVSYQEIARAGGGILSTVRATRGASADELLARAERVLCEMSTLGVTTVECKSGYGLDLESEIKTLKVYASLAQRSPLTLVPTFLGAHTVPLEYRERREEYLSLVVDRMLPEVVERNLARFCDVFVEGVAFTREEGRRVLTAAQKLGLRAKIHADQMSDGGGALLASELGAVSADHLEYISPEGRDAMARAGVVAVALPFATLYTRGIPLRARELVAAGVRVAVATDFNPGTAPSFHLPFAINLACTLYGLTPSEAVKGATYYAACALGMQDEIGSLEPGKSADFAIIDAPDVNHWVYYLRANSCIATFKNGKKIYSTEPFDGVSDS